MEKFGPLSCIKNNNFETKKKAPYSFYIDEKKTRKKNLTCRTIQIFLSTDALSQGNGNTQYTGTQYKASESAIGLSHYNIGLVIRDSVC